MHGRITYMLCRSETVIQQCICILSDTIQSFPPPIISNIPIPTYNTNHYTSTASASATADEDQPSTLQHKRNPTSDNNTFSSHARRKALQKRSRFKKKCFSTLTLPIQHPLGPLQHFTPQHLWKATLSNPQHTPQRKVGNENEHPLHDQENGRKINGMSQLVNTKIAPS